MERSQRRELTQQMQRSTGSYELVLAPLLLAFLALMVDRWLGTTPILTIMAAVLGLTGAVIKIYYSYVHEMNQHDADATWKPDPTAEQRGDADV